MSWEDFGGPRNLDPEARRLAYMLNTGDPRAEHSAAVQLSQDLYGLPSSAQVDLVRRTQMYDAQGLGGQIEIQPVLSQGYNGSVYDTGSRVVKVVDRYNGVDDDVTVMTGTNAGYRNPNFRIDLFAGINDCRFNSTPWLNREWREHEMRERHNWNERANDWNYYDGRNYGRPGFQRPTLGVEIGIGNVDIGIGIPLGNNNHKDQRWENHRTQVPVVPPVVHYDRDHDKDRDRDKRDHDRDHDHDRDRKRQWDPNDFLKR